MPSQGPLGVGTGANQSPGPGNDALGAWANPGNITLNDGNGSTCGPGGSSLVELSCKLVKGGSISGAEKSTGAAIPGVATFVSYGGSTDLHGLTLTPADVNASNFGFAFAVRSVGGSGSNWLIGTNCGFSIPGAATIDGVLAEVEQSQSGNSADVDFMRITVFYTLGTGNAVTAWLRA